MNASLRLLAVLVVFISTWFARANAAEPTPEDLEFFERKIRPILSEVCQKCHGKAKQESGLRLDSRAGFQKGGEQGKVWDEKQPGESRLLKAIQYSGDLQMPPKAKLPADQIDAFTEWFRRGAPWPADAQTNAADRGEFDLEGRRTQQWALQPITQVSPPEVKHSEWVQTPIDRFIVARWESDGTTPAALADKRSLLRRLTFDLTGLPPTRDELAKFLADTSPRALETVVDRLLASERYGERWGRHWLDLVRFAETSGHEFDFEIPHAFEYRDYVIRAFNHDIPYDQFLTEHIAGDLLTHPRRHPSQRFNESIIGTGFWFLGESKHSPVDIRVDSAERLDNQVDVFAKAFLAQTVACARCHDHKFDAISTRDYHALCGFVQSSRMQIENIDDPTDRNKLVQQLLKSEENIRLSIHRQIAELDAGKIASYLIAAQAVAEWKPSSSEATTEVEQLFADFEGDDYAGWKATGNAFGQRPNRLPLPDYQGDVGSVGKGLVSSHSALDANGNRTASDNLTGTLRSPEFEIRHRYIHFLVGGGAHVGKTCINLHLAGEERPIASVTGKNNNRMEWSRFDVSKHAGKKAFIEVVDAEVGGWGNIALDHVHFNNLPIQGLMGHGIVHVAKAHKLDPQQLARWVSYLRTTARENRADPWNFWGEWLAQSTTSSPETWATFVAEQKQRLEQQREARRQRTQASTANPKEQPDGATAEPLTANAEVNVSVSSSDAARATPRSTTSRPHPGFDFRNGFKGFFVSGEAFGDRPTEAFDVNGPGLTLAGQSSLPLANSSRFLLRLQGALRSPTFEIPSERIFYRVAGRNTRIRLVIDQFQQIRYPIYGGLEIAINSPDKLSWITQDVSKWVGHLAYFEVLDEGDGYVVVEQVRMNEPTVDQTMPVSMLTEKLLSDGEFKNPQAAAKQLAQVFADQLRAESGTPDRASKESNQSSSAIEPFKASLKSWVMHDCLSDASLFRKDSAEKNPLTTSLLAHKDLCDRLESQVAYHKRAITLADGSPVDEHVHPRGNPNKFAEIVPRRLLESLGGTNGSEYGPGSGRLELAQRMVDPQNPLVSRVIVNRLWKHHFGEGLVRTVDDFGNMGQKPSHPELLDWLAGDLVRRKWSLKAMHRMMVLSRVYSLSTTPSDAATEQRDPLNLTLHRAHLRRLEGETIRDAVLAVSGRLNPTMYGPSVMPHLTPFMIGRGRPGTSGPLDGDGRRSIYLGVRRNFLNPMFQAFDTPVPFTTIGRRSVSNVPAQALSMLNNPFVTQQAHTWAALVISQPGNDASRIQFMYESAFARLPDETETASALEFLAEQKKLYANGSTDQAWADLAHVLLNVKEFVWIP